MVRVDVFSDVFCRPQQTTSGGLFYQDSHVKLYLGDSRVTLDLLPDESIQCVVTSPPYWAKLDYGIEPSVWGGDGKCQHVWRGHPSFNEVQRQGASAFCINCSAWKGTLGNEPTPQLFCSNIVEVFEKVRRVLRPDGVVWLNIGDSYNGSGGAHKPHHKNPGLSNSAERRGSSDGVHADSLKEKDLCLIPARVALALQDVGWYIRSDVIWDKPNGMPESVKDRPSKHHEYVWLLSKSPRYYYDRYAIKETPIHAGRLVKATGMDAKNATHSSNTAVGFTKHDTLITARTASTVWHIPVEAVRAAHFASFPLALAERCIKAGSRPGDTVLDPFVGTGTTCAAAAGLDRFSIGCDRKEEFLNMAIARLRAPKGRI